MEATKCRNVAASAPARLLPEEQELIQFLMGAMVKIPFVKLCRAFSLIPVYVRPGRLASEIQKTL